MSSSQQSLRATIVPTLRYRNLDAAAVWLESAFGFELRAVERDSAGRMSGAQAVLGGGMVILAPVGESAYDAVMRQPDEIGGGETQSCYIVVADPDAHYAKAKAHGAEIVLDLQTLDHGGVGYLCRDLEGHLWSFGNSNPWGADTEARGPVSRIPVSRIHVLAAVGLLAIGAAAYAGWLVARPAATDAATPTLAATLDKERAARVDAEADVKRKSDELSKVSREREALLQDAKRLEDRAAAAAREADKVRESRARDVKEAVAKERDGKQKSERAAADLRDRLKQERAAREKAEKGRAEALEGLAQEKAARARAEASLQAALDAQMTREQQGSGVEADDRPVLRDPPKRAVKTPGSAPSAGEPMPDFRP